MTRHFLGGVLALCSCMAANPAWAIYDQVVLPTPDGFWGFNINNPSASALKWSPTGGHDGGGYYYVSNWGDEGLFTSGDYQSARVYYRMPVLPYNERMYNIYAWNPTANSSQWHILNINSDGLDSAGHSPNISWPGQFNTNAQWIQYPADGPIAQGGWVKLGPGPQTDANADGGRGVYFNPPDGYSNPSDVHAPSVYVKYQPWYNGDIAFSAIRIVEVVEDNGDFDMDQDVDGNDLLVWQRGGSPNGVTPGDLQLWKDTFGMTSSAVSSAAVPEPASALMVLLGTCIAGGVANARTRRTRARQ